MKKRSVSLQLTPENILAEMRLMAATTAIKVMHHGSCGANEAVECILERYIGRAQRLETQIKRALNARRIMRSKSWTRKIQKMFVEEVVREIRSRPYFFMAEIKIVDEEGDGLIFRIDMEKLAEANR